MAKLADALASGASGSNLIGVQVPASAPPKFKSHIFVCKFSRQKTVLQQEGTLFTLFFLLAPISYKCYNNYIKIRRCIMPQECPITCPMPFGPPICCLIMLLLMGLIWGTFSMFIAKRKGKSVPLTWILSFIPIVNLFWTIYLASLPEKIKA